MNAVVTGVVTRARSSGPSIDVARLAWFSTIGRSGTDSLQSDPKAKTGLRLGRRSCRDLSAFGPGVRLPRSRPSKQILVLRYVPDVEGSEVEKCSADPLRQASLF